MTNITFGYDLYIGNDGVCVVEHDLGRHRFIARAATCQGAVAIAIQQREDFLDAIAGDPERMDETARLILGDDEFCADQ